MEEPSTDLERNQLPGSRLDHALKGSISCFFVFEDLQLKPLGHGTGTFRFKLLPSSWCHVAHCKAKPIPLVPHGGDQPESCDAADRAADPESFG